MSTNFFLLLLLIYLSFLCLLLLLLPTLVILTCNSIRLSFFWLLPLLRLGYHVPLEQVPVEEARAKVMFTLPQSNSLVIRTKWIENTIVWAAGIQLVAKSYPGWSDTPAIVGASQAWLPAPGVSSFFWCKTWPGAVLFGSPCHVPIHLPTHGFPLMVLTNASLPCSISPSPAGPSFSPSLTLCVPPSGSPCCCSNS